MGPWSDLDQAPGGVAPEKGTLWPLMTSTSWTSLEVRITADHGGVIIAVDVERNGVFNPRTSGTGSNAAEMGLETNRLPDRN